MKKYISLIAVAASLVLVGCTAEEGTEPGNDGAPRVVVYSYNPGGEYNPDNDVAIRITANNEVDELYYIVEPAAAYEENLSSKGEAGYADYVVSNGTKVELVENEFDGVKTFDTILTDIKGENKIVAVGISGKKYGLGNTTFVGLSWTVLATGTYSSELLAKLGIGAFEATLQQCDQDPTRFRFPDLLVEGYHRVFTLTGKEQEDADGDKFFNVLVANQEIGLTYGNYGMISARDVATWQNNTNYLVYNVFYPDYNYVIIWTQYNVTAGNLGYGDDEFSPAE